MSTTAPFLGQPARQVVANFTTLHPDARLYSLSGATGQISALVAGDVLFSFRTGSSGMYVVLSCSMFGYQVGTGTAKVLANRLRVARSFTASDTGGTDLTPAGNDAKSRTSDLSSTVASVRIANVAALTAGTRTLDAQNMAFPTNGGAWSGKAGAAGARTIISSSSIIAVNAFGGFSAADVPLILGPNEGFVVDQDIDWPAATTFVLEFNVAWFEVPSW